MDVIFAWIPSIKYFEGDAAIFGGDSEEVIFSEAKNDFPNPVRLARLGKSFY